MCVINKIDQMESPAHLLPHIARLDALGLFEEIIPVSALRGTGLDRLKREVLERLPEGPHLFPPDQVTDRSERFIAGEIVREKLMRRLGDELPHRITVVIENYRRQRTDRRDRRDDIRRARWPEGDHHRPQWQLAEVGRAGGARRHRSADRTQSDAAFVGQGQGRLDQQRVRPAGAWDSTDMTRRIVGEPAYVLHTRAYRETSAIIDLLTLAAWPPQRGSAGRATFAKGRWSTASVRASVGRLQRPRTIADVERLRCVVASLADRQRACTPGST